ncbi:putative vacuolar protein sorting-associated protein [Arabidopsis thaliana]
MELEFRRRDYGATHKSQFLPRSQTQKHPLSSTLASRDQQAKTVRGRDLHFFDPLRGLDVNASAEENVEDTCISIEAVTQDLIKEWKSLKRILMQRFPVSKVISFSPISNIITKGSKVESPSALSHPEETGSEQTSLEEPAKIISQHEYIAKVHELRDGINSAWQAEDRVTSLKLSIKVTKLLMDTTVLRFYPTVFVIVTDMLDMLGDMVWERIKQKAELDIDGTMIFNQVISALKQERLAITGFAKLVLFENFSLACKAPSIIIFLILPTFLCLSIGLSLYAHSYLELAILPCWRFLINQPMEVLDRLVMMVRGLADPLTSLYCRLYMVHRMQKFGFCSSGVFLYYRRQKVTFSLVEPAIEYIMKCLFLTGRQENNVLGILEELGFGRNKFQSSYNSSHVSILLHYLLKELPSELVSSLAMEILDMIRCSNDCSFSQVLNYRLLGNRLSEGKSQEGFLSSLIDEVIQAASQYQSLYDYLRIMDAYVDLMLQNKMENHLDALLDDIVSLARDKFLSEEEQASLQSIILKLLSHFENLQEVLPLNHFIEILDLMSGTSKSSVNMHLLNMGTRNGCICDSTTVQLLFEVSQALYDATDFVNIKDDDNRQTSHLISRFVEMVDYGAEMERHLLFLAECREAFNGIHELKETLVRSSNTLAVKALKAGKKHINFVKSCLAFSEVTIPSISSPTKHLNLYLETAEVALLGGLISHSDELVMSAVEYLENVALTDGLKSIDIDSMASVICKLCSLLVMIPGNPEKGVMEILKSIFSATRSSSWATLRVKVKIFCAIMSLLSTLSQDNLPYHSANPEIIGNELLFFGDSSYKQELVSCTQLVLSELLDAIEQESSQISRGNMALEACNCISSALVMNEKVKELCLRLLETAKGCLGANDRYIESTKKSLQLRYTE